MWLPQVLSMSLTSLELVDKSVGDYQDCWAPLIKGVAAGSPWAQHSCDWAQWLWQEQLVPASGGVVAPHQRADQEAWEQSRRSAI